MTLLYVIGIALLLEYATSTEVNAGSSLCVYDKKMNWTVSRDHCEKMKGSLLVLDTQAKWDQLSQFSSDNPLPEDKIWIGMTVSKGCDNFTWINGRHFTVEQNLTQLSEFTHCNSRSCVAYQQGILKTASCMRKFRPICEKRNADSSLCVYDKKMNWTVSRDHCEKLKGSLLVLDSQPKWDQLSQFSSDNPLPEEKLWIGMRTLSKGCDNFTWINGNQFIEEQNLTKLSEFKHCKSRRCVAYQQGILKTASCGKNFRPICEKTESTKLPKESTTSKHSEELRPFPENKESTPRDSNESSTPRDSNESSTPTESKESSTPRDSNKSTTPRDSNESSTPTESKESSTPRDSNKSTTPRDSNESSTPRDSKESSTPRDRNESSTPRDSNESSTPRDSNESSTPRDSKESSTPKDSNELSTPRDSNESSTPKDSNESSTPRDSNESSTPKDSNESSTPRDSKESSTPKDSIELSTPRESKESSTPRDSNESPTPRDLDESATARGHCSPRKEPNGTKLSKEEIEKIVIQLKEKMRIRKANTNAYKRSHVSVYDSRLSCVFIGVIWCVLLAVVVGWIAIPDFVNLFWYLYRCYHTWKKVPHHKCIPS